MGWVLGCPDLPTVNLIGYKEKNRLQRGVRSVITRILRLKSVIMRCKGDFWGLRGTSMAGIELLLQREIAYSVDLFQSQVPRTNRYPV